MTRASGLAAALVLSIGCTDDQAGTPPVVDPCAAFEEHRVELPSGTLRGHRSGDSCAFLGIAYAGAASGERRFRPPERPSTRSAVIDAHDFGPPCAQFDADGRIIGSEACLSLNVWTPGIGSEPRPVLVFFHGGGNVSGSNADPDHDGRELATRGGLVVVTPNFRLGTLGYLAHHELGRENTAASSGNYGLLDQIAALEWVRENVAAFGGDPGRVLLVGQSAGSRNACALVASPLARGLFSSMALHSGACNLRSLAEQELIGAEIARSSGCANAPDVPGCLRALDLPRLMNALPGIPGPMVASEHNPNVDGWLLERAPLETIAAGEHSRVPMIVSTTQDEVASAIAPGLTAEDYPGLVEALFGADFRPKMLEYYPLESFESPRAALVRMITDARYACPARRTARAGLAGGSTVYRTVWEHGLEWGPESELGAYHGVELLFLFRSFERHGHAPTAGELAESDRMIQRYARFAATGDLDGLKPYDGSDDASGAHCDFWDTF